MKKIMLIVLMAGCSAYAQNDTIKIADLRIPNSPALTLLDKSFSVVETVSSPNAVNVDLVNIKDNSVEVTPYWINRRATMSVEEYYGIRADGTQSWFSNAAKASVSAAYTPGDSLTTFSLGVRSNVINIKKSSAKLLYVNYNAQREAYINGTAPGKSVTRLQEKMATAPNLAEAKTALSDEYDSQNVNGKKLALEAAKNALNTPWLSLDLAAAASGFFPGNERSDGRFGRYGLWTSLKVVAVSNKKYTNFINLFGFARLLEDRTQFDVTANSYSKNNFTDIGGKLEFRFHRFAMAGEYVNRSNDAIDYRLVGLLEYKINDNLFINGGYGKDFENPDGNLATLFGIKWGLNKKSSVSF